MSEPYPEPVHVPTREELLAKVAHGRLSEAEPVPGTADPAPSPDETRPCERSADRMSVESEKVLRHVATSLDRNLGITDHCREAGVRSGSVEKRVVAELHARGFIRLERKGRLKAVHLYPSAWTYLGIDPPTAEGRGGALHRQIVASIASLFKARGYDVRIEHEVGADRKRVDLVAFGVDRIVGVEVGLSEVRQELKNLRADLETGVLDLVLVVSPDPVLLAELRRAAAADPYLGPRLDRVRFTLYEEESAT